jgi:hypothetical protein
LVFTVLVLQPSVADSAQGHNVRISINGDGRSSSDNASLKRDAAKLACSSFPDAITATVTIKGQRGTFKVKCSSVESDVPSTTEEPTPSTTEQTPSTTEEPTPSTTTEATASR